MRRVASLALGLIMTAGGCSWSGDGGVTPDTSTSTTAGAPGTTATTTAAMPGPITDSERRAARAAARAYVDAWAAGDHAAAAAAAVGGAGEIVAVLDAWAENLAMEDLTVTITDDDLTPEGGTVQFHAEATLGAIGSFDWSGSVTMVNRADGWRVAWAPSAVHPALESGGRVEVERTWPERAAILAADGTPIVAAGAMLTVGVVPGWIGDLETVLVQLSDLGGIDPGHVVEEMERPGVQPDWFVPVGTITEAEYGAFRDRWDSLAGVLLREASGRITIADPFAEHLIGAIGPITPELLAELGAPYSTYDVVGRSGLEMAHERTLAGTPDQQIRIVNRYGRVTAELLSVDGIEPQPLQTSLEIDAQLAAEAAIDTVANPVALVAVDTATGEVRAIASRPLGEFDRAINGLYPPGSTFKLVTTVALLEIAGVDPDGSVTCPGEIVVGGRRFTNAGGRDLGMISLADAIAASCNTTFAGLAAELLEPGDLVATAHRLGYGTDFAAGVTAASGSFPDPQDTAELAAAAIGQGRVLVTPLHAATIPAAIASGTWHAPTIVAGLGDGPAAQPLAPGTAEAIAGYMAGVVTHGTGTAAAVEGETVLGKTGSAEFGGATTHAWFVGIWRDLAIAIVVEEGGSGGSAAAPIAADFIQKVMALRGAGS